MTLKECDNYYNAVASSGLSWALGKSAIDSKEELIIIADSYGMALPSYFKHFVSSKAPGHVCATGDFRRLLLKLDELERKILADGKRDRPI